MLKRIITELIAETRKPHRPARDFIQEVILSGE